MMEILTIIIMLAIYFGFAGGLGELLHLSRKGYGWMTIAFFLLVFLPASFAIWEGPFTIIPWLVALGIMLSCAFRPGIIPDWMRSRQFVFLYSSVISLMIFAWVIIFGDPITRIGLGLPSAFVTIWGWKQVWGSDSRQSRGSR
ncbi:MAG: hypothetical protein MUO76_00570 [Anaerolineaceae bacterium]|nr:hypothetical protein [Anaerolineaceae bacterium]